MPTTRKSKSKTSRKREYAPVVARARKRTAGRTAIESTPVAIRATMPIDAEYERAIRQRLARALGRFATLLERGTVRFVDVNGPRGGVDTECRVKLVLSGMPSVIASARAATPKRAFTAVVPKVKAAATAAVEKRGLTASAGPRTQRASTSRSPASRAGADPGSLIGRRVGRGKENLEVVLVRAPKVDTSAPGVSASDRRAGGTSTARRNVKRRTSRMTATLEDSRTTPSRKSTRRSKNRSKSGNKLGQRARAESSSPSTRARRAVRDRARGAP